MNIIFQTISRLSNGKKRKKSKLKPGSQSIKRQQQQQNSITNINEVALAVSEQQYRAK